MRQIPSNWANDPTKRVGDTEIIWALLVQTAAFRRINDLAGHELGFWLDQSAHLVNGHTDDARAQLVRHASGRFEPGPALSVGQREFVRLYLPLLAARAGNPVVIAHLGQSIDAKIATETGDSYYVTGHENLLHLHRMRALCDAIIVGAGTVIADNPRLTTRLVEGPNPVRVVIDPASRVPSHHLVFADRQAPTLRVSAQSSLKPQQENDPQVVTATMVAGELALDGVVQALGLRGLTALFVEGGGITVSRWMQAGLLDRLQIATAPILVGPGRPALTLPPAASMQACLRPEYRLYQMGDDMLWDLDLTVVGTADREQRRGFQRLA